MQHKSQTCALPYTSPLTSLFDKSRSHKFTMRFCNQRRNSNPKNHISTSSGRHQPVRPNLTFFNDSVTLTSVNLSNSLKLTKSHNVAQVERRCRDKSSRKLVRLTLTRSSASLPRAFKFLTVASFRAHGHSAPIIHAFRR